VRVPLDVIKQANIEVDIEEELRRAK
jgi:hypothetical protein